MSRSAGARRLPVGLVLVPLLALAIAPGAAAVPAGPATLGPAAAAASGSSLPAGWPSTLQLGLADGPGGAAALRASAPFGFRYQYLAGGANTGQGWAGWNPDGSFATSYIRDSVDHGIVPVFTYYMIRQSAPGNGMDEVPGVFANLGNRATMAAYWSDLKLLFQRAGAFRDLVVVHVEPDMWGFAEQRSKGDDAAGVPAVVGSSGLAELAGIPDTIAGFAKAVVRLRDRYAPNVALGYHISVWGTGVDIAYSDPPDTEVDALATRAAAFYRSLGASFDVAFAEFSDRDAGFKQHVYGDGGASWWDARDFAANARFLGRFSALTGKRIVMWQIPLGNTRMRAMNDTWGHFQDNRVEWLLDDPGRSHLDAYVRAGVVAFLFGGGADGTTCACDAMHDGVTNPPPIDGNTRASLSADDDGGFFRDRAAAYYAAGPIRLDGVGPGPSPSASPASSPSPRPSPTLAPAAGWTSRATASAARVRAGTTVSVSAIVRRSAAGHALVDVEVYDGHGRKVFQRWFDRQAFRAGVARTFRVTWKVPGTAAAGRYTVKIGVFAPAWASLYAWNNGAATITVSR